MKINSNFIYFLTFSFLLIISCGEKEEKDKSESKAIKKNESETKSDMNEVSEINDLKVRIFFNTTSYDENGEVIGENISERESFQAKKGYVFCYDSESFHSLKLEGNGKAVTLNVSSNDGFKFKKENFELDGETTFTNKDFELMGGGSTYSITVTQNGKELFKGEVNSQGCM